MAHPNSSQAVTLSVRVHPDIRDQLEELADATGRTKSFLIARGVENYLITQAWQIKATKKAIERANGKNAKFVDHDRVEAWVESWDSKNVKDIPQ